MAHKLGNMVRQTGVSTSPTTVVLTGAPTAPFRSFASLLANGDTTEAMVVDPVTGDWQNAKYSFSGGVLTFVELLSSPTGSPVAFANGAKIVYISPVAETADLVASINGRTTDLEAAHTGTIVTAGQSPYGVTPGSHIRVDTTLDEIVINLWPSPQDGDPAATIEDFSDTWDDNNLLLVAPEGTTFEPSGATTVRFTDGGVAFSVWYFNSGWRISLLTGG